MDMMHNDANGYCSNHTKSTVEAVVVGGVNFVTYDGHNLKNASVDNNNNNVQEECGDNEEKEEEEVREKEKKGEEELDEGFFEIEAVRRKRIRKGELQYLIKWRGWPESSNTWEPLENLQSCSDVIAAFEDSLRSGKLSRKRRYNYGVTRTHPKKKQQRSSASHNVTGQNGENNVDVSIAKTAMKDAENGSTQNGGLAGKKS